VTQKICVITGATDGIGKRTAEVLAGQGFILGLVGRNQEKGKKVVQELSTQSENDNIHYFNADLSLMSEVTKVAGEIQDKFPVIDVLINNVGAAFFEQTFTSEGFESTFALNHLSYFLLTKLLLDKMNQQSARIVNVASDAHIGAGLNFNDLQGVNPYSGYPNYQRSKLMNILFSNELALKLNDRPIAVNCLHPGFVASKFGHNNSGLKVAFLKIAQKLKAITVEEGAETSVYLASSPEVEKTSGKYYYKRREKESSPESRDEGTRKRLWDVTEEL
ncbi:uncharacterized protein METZ01_LOCUS318547, partial [marine metagenome]